MKKKIEAQSIAAHRVLMVVCLLEDIAAAFLDGMTVQELTEFMDSYSKRKRKRKRKR